MRRIAVVVRDDAWGTLDPALEQVDVDEHPNGFVVRIAARCQRDEIDLRWSAVLCATADGTLSCEAVLTPLTDFAYNRVGLVVLHPLDGVAGAELVATTPAGAVHGRFPELVGPQRIVDGLPAPLFPSFSALTIAPADGPRVQLRFDGDLFETEDQRNWTDGSFKTYSTPLALGFPHRATAGTPLTQRLRLEVDAGADSADLGAGVADRGADDANRGADDANRGAGDADRGAGDADAPIAVRVGEVVGTVPAVGVLLDAGEPAAAAVATAAAALAPAHLRVELLADDDRATAAARFGAAAASGLPLELALVGAVDPVAAAELARAAAAEVARVLVLPARGVTDAAAAAAARAAFPAVEVGGGSAGHFADVNATPPEAGLDALAFAASPQVHQFDDDTLRESLEALPAVARSAAALAPGLPVRVSPLTLRPRSGPGSEPRDGLPAGTDPRQPTPFAAAWTLAAVAALGAGGAASVTAHALLGARGVVAPDGTLLPAGEAVRALAALAGAPLREVEVDRPLTLAALAADTPGGTAVLLANLTAAPVTVALGGETIALPPHAWHAHAPG